jgi:hypothetical protein
MNAEAIEQLKVVEWLRQTTDIPFFHIANERKTTPQMGAFLARMGVRSGVSDLFLPRGNHVSKGLWLEMKTENGRASLNQIAFQREMRLERYGAEVAYGAEEAIMYIKSFYGLE